MVKRERSKRFLISVKFDDIKRVIEKRTGDTMAIGKMSKRYLI
jgi:hypothetical protein